MTIDFVIVVACETRKRHIEDPKRSFTNTFLYFLRWLVLVGPVRMPTSSFNRGAWVLDIMLHTT